MVLKKRENNPSGNILSPDMPDDLVAEAVNRSGYPLQTLVAIELKRNFGVTEEWGYVDRETNIKRALDIFAYKEFSLEPKSQGRIVPSLGLLVECKRSESPYIFFKSATERYIPGFPNVLGLKSDYIEVHTNDGSSVRRNITDCLGLYDHKFIESDPIVCNTFSKVVRKGKILELSGTDPFNTIMMPLVSAIEHASAYYTRPYTQPVYYPVLALSICVIDAPMLVAEVDVGTTDLTFDPWVRVVRQEATINQISRTRDLVYYAVDFVHSAYLREFVEDHLLPFADFCRERMLKQQDIMANAKAYVRNLRDWQYNELSSTPL
jgi:hypothetical protein